MLKALAIVLARRLKPRLSEHCHHLAGHGGSKAAVRAVAEKLAAHTFVFRTDVKSYYYFCAFAGSSGRRPSVNRHKKGPPAAQAK